jgi:hypothetical protein
VASKRPASQGKGSRIAELGPALTGLGTLLVGVAAVIALVVTGPARTTEPEPTGTSVATMVSTASIQPSFATAAPPSSVPSSAASVTLDQLISEIRAVAARTNVPSDPDVYPDYVVTGPKAGMLAEVPKVWPDRTIDLWSDTPPDAPSDAPMEELGTILIATPNEKGLFEPGPEAYEIPMFIVSASRFLAADFRAGAILDMRNVSLGLRCDKEGSGPMTLGDYAGRYEVFARCAGSTAMSVQVELMAGDGSHVVGVTARIASSADIAAFDRGLRTLRIEVDRLLR